MRTISLLMNFILCGVCLGVEKEPVVASQDKQPNYKGKTYGEWISLANNKDSEVRAAAADVLKNPDAEDRVAVPALIDLLKHTNTDIRQAAAEALGHFGSEAKIAAPALAAFVRNEGPNTDTCRAATNALVMIGPAAVPALTELLKDKSSNVRLAAAQALGEIGPDEATVAIPALMASLKDKDQWVRNAATEALGHFGPEAVKAVTALTDLLGDKNPNIQQMAAGTLGKIGPGAKAAVPMLVELLKKVDLGIQGAAAEALGNIGPDAREAVPALIELLKDAPPWAAVEALGKIGSGAKAAVPALTELLTNDNSSLRSDIVESLGKIGPDAKAAVPALIGLLEDGDDCVTVAMTLGKIGPEPKTAIPRLTALVKDKSKDMFRRQATALVLATIGLEATPTLTGLLKDDDEDVRWLASWALAEIGPAAKAALPALVELLKERNEPIRRCVARALGGIGSEAVPVLTELLKDNDVLVRWTAVNAFAKISPATKAARPALTELLKDRNQEVRTAAASVLGKANLEMAITDADIKRIKGYIADLAKTESSDCGLSPTLTGDVFAPAFSSECFGKGLLPYHRPKQIPAFVSLVELGPKALPFLLESLDDKTPTKLTVNLGADLDGMAFGHEIHGNPFNMQETKVLAHVGGYHCDWGLMRAETYTVRVGDICFIAIGQITNRSYNAVRYQPTNCMVVNSTSKDKAMAAEVRAIWGKSDYRRKLLDSLLIDFPGRGPFGDYLEIGAAMRLTYYFPEASQDTVVTRLKQLEPAMIEPSNGFAGKWYEGFVQAVSWSPQSKIRAELLELFGKTKDPRVLLAALPGIRREHDQLVFQRLTEQLAVLPKDEPGPYFDGYYLLIALGDRFPQRAEPVFQTYSKPGTIGRRRNLIHALRETCGDLSVGLLASLLEDKRNSGSDYSVNRDDNVPRLSIRVCDEAAETISKNSKTLKFVMEGSHQNLDRQIESMRQKIAEMKRLK